MWLKIFHPAPHIYITLIILLQKKKTDLNNANLLYKFTINRQFFLNLDKNIDVIPAVFPFSG